MKTKAEAKSILDGKFCLTGDTVLKMLAFYYRIRCGIPVVLLGECGCGKTFLIKYMCEWIDADLLILDIHGGTTLQDILGIFKDGEEKLIQGNYHYALYAIYIITDHRLFWN